LVEAADGLVGKHPLQVIDLGSGPGDLAKVAIEMARRRGISMQVTCVDRITPPTVRDGHPTVLVMDLFDAPTALGTGTFDVAYASLVLHHLSDADVQRALFVMSSLARHRVVWTDLVRDRVGCVGAWVSTCLRHPQVRHDAVTSVRRSFTIDEAIALAESVGLTEITVRRRRGACFTLVGVPGCPPEQRPMIRADRLSVRRGSTIVLRDHSCVVRSGSVLHVRGPNGSGKSSLLRCLVGALPADCGRAWVDRSGGAMGFHPQDGGLMRSMSVAGNIELACRLGGVRGAAREIAVRRSLAEWSLVSNASVPVSRLSGGEARRAALAATFVHGPAVVLLDEPDAGLDAEGRATLARVVESTLTQGGAALIAAHAPDPLPELPSRMKAVPVDLP
jgi:heme exporter protein A